MTYEIQAWTQAADAEIRESGREERPQACCCGWWRQGWLGSVEHGASHYAELQGAVICYCAQLSVKSPRRAERTQISSFPLPLSLHHHPRPQLFIQPSIFAPASLGPSSSLEGAAGQLQASAGTGSGSLCRSALPLTRIISLSCYLMCFWDSEFWHLLEKNRKSLNKIKKFFCIIRFCAQLM